MARMESAFFHSWMSDGLADVVVTEAPVSYEIRFYTPNQVGGKVDGLYTVTGNPDCVWRIENPAPGSNSRVKVTKADSRDHVGEGVLCLLL